MDELKTIGEELELEPENCSKKEATLKKLENISSQQPKKVELLLQNSYFCAEFEHFSENAADKE